METSLPDPPERGPEAGEPDVQGVTPAPVEGDPDGASRARAGVGWFFLWGVVAPWLTVLIGLISVLRPDSRQDRLDEQFLILLGGPAFFIMLPLVVVGLVAILSYTASEEPDRPGRSPGFRAALGIGVAVGVWFQFVVFMSHGWRSLGFIGGPVFLYVLPFVSEHFGPRGVRRWRVVAAVGLPLTALIVTPGMRTDIELVLLLPIYAAFAGSPAMLAVCCATALRRIGQEHGRILREDSLRPAITAATAFPVVLVTSIHRGLADYAALPPYQGDCFIATAAARGHRGFVGGGPGVLPRQLATLKAGELALRATCPSLHRAARRVYDRVGPPAARQIAGPWRADLVHVLLVPPAALVRLVLAVALPGWASEASVGKGPGASGRVE